MLLPAQRAHGRPADDDDEIDKYFPSLSPIYEPAPSAETRIGASAGEGNTAGARTTGVDESVTDVVFMDVGVCPEGLRANRTLGDKSAICSTSEPLGRIVIGGAPSCRCFGNGPTHWNRAPCPNHLDCWFANLRYVLRVLVRRSPHDNVGIEHLRCVCVCVGE
jgi:hypothetical protein